MMKIIGQGKISQVFNFNILGFDNNECKNLIIFNKLMKHSILLHKFFL